MSYRNAKDYLPEELLKEVQKYASGILLYIPLGDEPRKEWGTHTGSRNDLDKRNSLICRDFNEGSCIKDISQRYFLSEESIKKIIYAKSKKSRC